jgi:hypothetical protein
MEGVGEVRLESEEFLLWKVEIAGKIKQWEGEITNQLPDQEISWEVRTVPRNGRQKDRADGEGGWQTKTPSKWMFCLKRTLLRISPGMQLCPLIRRTMV